MKQIKNNNLNVRSRPVSSMYGFNKPPTRDVRHYQEVELKSELTDLAGSAMVQFSTTIDNKNKTLMPPVYDDDIVFESTVMKKGKTCKNDFERLLAAGEETLNLTYKSIQDSVDKFNENKTLENAQAIFYLKTRGYVTEDSRENLILTEKAKGLDGKGGMPAKGGDMIGIETERNVLGKIPITSDADTQQGSHFFGWW